MPCGPNSHGMVMILVVPVLVVMVTAWQAVGAFLDEVLARSRPKARAELAVLQAAKLATEGDSKVPRCSQAVVKSSEFTGCRN